MPRRRQLRGAARAVLESFNSRNNDVDGYWGLGKLYAHALGSGHAQVSINLLSGDVTPPSDAFGPMAAQYRAVLARQLAGSHLVDELQSASIVVRFDIAGANHVSNSSNGDLCNSKVTLTDDLGRSYEFSATGRCWPHDPNKESRSGRVSAKRD